MLANTVDQYTGHKTVVGVIIIYLTCPGNNF